MNNNPTLTDEVAARIEDASERTRRTGIGRHRDVMERRPSGGMGLVWRLCEWIREPFKPLANMNRAQVANLLYNIADTC
jgi:hypothetical protein